MVHRAVFANEFRRNFRGAYVPRSVAWGQWRNGVGRPSLRVAVIGLYGISGIPVIRKHMDAGNSGAQGRDGTELRSHTE